MVKKGKNRSKEKKVGKRTLWKKGFSSSSNPQVKKHRDAAKNRFFQSNIGKSGLTVAALQKHDAREYNVQYGDEEADSKTTSANSLSTWASNWTDCTNVTFQKVHRYISSNSAVHKSILAVLAAITDVIKSHEGKETDTEYFAALMTALDNPDNDDETISAITHLLAICIKKVPIGVLQNKFSESSKLLMNLLADHINTATPSIITSTVKCLSTLLKSQEHTVWSLASTIHVFNSILTFTVHVKPRIRKTAQVGVNRILRFSEFMKRENAPAHHPACAATITFCVQQIENCGGSGDATITLHVLGLLQDILDISNKSSLKSACETILKVMTLANVLVTTVSMKCLFKLFKSKPKETTLPAQLNAQIITALYDFKPSDNDSQLMTAWLSVMREAHANLSRLNEDLFISHVPRFFSVAMNAMKNSNNAIAKMATSCLTSLIEENMSGDISEKLGKDLENSNSPAHKLMRIMETGLSYQYHACWEYVLQILAAVFEVWGKYCHPIMAKCLKSLGALRDTDNFAHKGSVDRAVGMAVRSMGPNNVLKALPLQDSGDIENFDFQRSWLLPIFRENIRETEIAFFTSYFLHLAIKIRARGQQYAAEGRMVESKLCETVQMQIWSLLPGFCTRPTDLLMSFKGLAKILGTALRERVDLRMDILSSIRRLILQNMDNEENKAELARFAKNYLPLFFNFYVTDSEDFDAVRCAVLETVKIYIKIADTQLINGYVDMCLEKIAEPKISPPRNHALLDLLVAMVHGVTSDRLKNVYEYAVQKLQSLERTIQKKAYRILEMICSGTSNDCTSFVASKLNDLQNNLLSSLSRSNPSSKAPRIRCLIHIFRHLNEENMEILQAVIPEAILCTKETAEKARGAAYVLLAELGQALLRWNPDTPKAAVIQIYFEFVLAGLAGKTHLVSCTLCTLNHLTLEFKDYISDELLATLIESTCMLLQSSQRPIVDSALEYLKHMIGLFDAPTIGQFLEKIVGSLISIKENHRRQLRFQSKPIYVKLVKKFGYNVVFNLVPDTHHKLLTHIRKMQERAKRQKDGKNQDDEDSGVETSSVPKAKPENFNEYLADSDIDSDLEVDDGKKNVKHKKSKKEKKSSAKGGTWLHEGKDDVIDFLDPSVSQKVLSNIPKSLSEVNAKKQRKDSPFKLASDGRMIIQEESDEEETKGKANEMEMDELDEMFNVFERGKKKLHKRRFSGGDEDEEPAAKYKAGGRGIHRSLKHEQVPGAEYKAKGNVKGDIKKKGKPDPYAYIPLQRTSLNKRKQAKVKGQFTSFVKGASKGASKGQKLRQKRKR